MAGEKIDKINQAKQEYLTDFLTLLSYLIQKGEMEENEDKFQQQMKKAKGGR